MIVKASDVPSFRSLLVVWRKDEVQWILLALVSNRKGIQPQKRCTNYKLIECTLPPLLFLLRRCLFSYLRRTRSDGVKEDVWRLRSRESQGGPANPVSLGRIAVKTVIYSLDWWVTLWGHICVGKIKITSFPANSYWACKSLPYPSAATLWNHTYVGQYVCIYVCIHHSALANTRYACTSEGMARLSWPY